jgi:hypothetical protein
MAQRSQGDLTPKCALCRNLGPWDRRKLPPTTANHHPRLAVPQRSQSEAQSPHSQARTVQESETPLLNSEPIPCHVKLHRIAEHCRPYRRYRCTTHLMSLCAPCCWGSSHSRPSHGHGNDHSNPPLGRYPFLTSGQGSSSPNTPKKGTKRTAKASFRSLARVAAGRATHHVVVAGAEPRPGRVAAASLPDAGVRFSPRSGTLPLLLLPCFFDANIVVTEYAEV